MQPRNVTIMATLMAVTFTPGGCTNEDPDAPRPTSTLDGTDGGADSTSSGTSDTTAGANSTAGAEATAGTTGGGECGGLVQYECNLLAYAEYCFEGTCGGDFTDSDNNASACVHDGDVAGASRAGRRKRQATGLCRPRFSSCPRFTR